MPGGRFCEVVLRADREETRSPRTAAGGATEAAPEAAKEEEKEESDDDMGFGLFD